MASKSAIKEAKKTLGGIDLSYYDKLTGQIKKTAESDKSNLLTTYNAYKANLEKDKIAGRQDFGKARATIAEDSFDRGRGQTLDLASRGIGNSGLAQLGDVQNRMETGRQVSGVADTFYKNLDSIIGKETTAKTDFTKDTTGIDNSLNTNLIALEGEKSDKLSSYKQSVASLAQQIQAAWDAKAEAARARAAAAADRNKPRDPADVLALADNIIKDFEAKMVGRDITQRDIDNVKYRLKSVGAGAYYSELAPIVKNNFTASMARIKKNLAYDRQRALEEATKNNNKRIWKAINPFSRLW